MLASIFTTGFRDALLTGAFLAIACAVLSVIVVLRRWAFIGEGISHAGFGGIGTAWLLSLAFPSLAGQAGVYAVAICFCLAMAVAIGWLSRENRLSGDTAIGIVLVASLAWGFVAFAVLRTSRPTLDVSWERYLLGDVNLITPAAMRAGVCLSIGVLLAVTMLWKEISAYCFDPRLAQVSGVPVTFIHYLLMILLALMIVVGMRLAGNLLVPALLVLPGATALQMSRRIRVVIAIAIAVNLLGVVFGLLFRQWWLPAVPSGPAVALALVVEFALVFAATKLIPRRTV